MKSKFDLSVLGALFLVLVLVSGCSQNVAVTGEKYTGLLITPETTTVTAGDTLRFQINGLYVKSAAATVPVTWEVSGGIGTIDADGLFLATAEGVGTVEARSGALAGAAQVTVLKAPAGENYYPHANGYSWVMKGTDGSTQVITIDGTAIISSTVTQVFRSATTYPSGSSSTSESYYKVDNSGVYLYGSSGYPYVPPLLLFKFPLKVGNTWQVFNATGFSVEARVTSQESLTVPAGTFNCFLVEWKMYYGTVEGDKNYFWLGQNAGIIKTTTTSSTVETVLQSKNF
jgi:hypothetical protein